MKNIIDLIKKYNNVKKFIFLSMPFGNKIRNPYIIKFNEIIEKISNENNGIFLNYFFNQQKDPSLVNDNMHFSEKPHKLISRDIIKIVEIIKIE